MNIIETKQQTATTFTFNYVNRPIQINKELKEAIDETEEIVEVEEFDFKAYFNNLAIA